MYKKEIIELTNKLNMYRDAYYNNNKSLISDLEYDMMYDKLLHLESETRFFMSNSPTRTVGYIVEDKLNKIKHSHEMLSLDKTKSIDDLRAFAGKRECVLSLKMDGLTVLLTYDETGLIRGETRGNGEIGEDITHNALTFKNIPMRVDNISANEYEGEAIITYSDFNKINSKLLEENKYKNPRNLASGSIRQLDSSIAAERNLKFVLWKVPEWTSTMVESFEFAKAYGFDVVPYRLYNPGKDNLDVLIEDLKREAEELGYPIDGLVMTYNDIAYGKSLGMTGHHPKHSIAFKFYDEEYETKLIDIEWTMGKTGILTPTAVFEPVEIDGTIVERASLHNLSVMYELWPHSWHSNLTVYVYKANAIIPQISRVEHKINSIAKRLDYPKECPICGGKTEIVQDYKSKVLVCMNPNCKGKLLGKLNAFVSKKAHDINGLSEATLQLLIDKGYITKPVDIYKLEKHRTALMWLPGLGKKSVDKLLDAIDASRKTTLAKFVTGLNIPLIGSTASKTIDKYFKGDVKEFLRKWDTGLMNWRTLNDFGNEMHTSMVAYYRNNKNDILELVEEFEFDANEKEVVTGIDLTGMTFVITGSLNLFKNRDELKDKIEAAGGKVSGSVSKKTTALINNDVNSTSGKNKKAIENGVKIMSEEEFISFAKLN